MTTVTKSYAIVTFGTSPRQKTFRSLESAKKAAESHWQKRCCSTIRIYECDTQSLAKTADISAIRQGESVVWQR